MYAPHPSVFGEIAATVEQEVRLSPSDYSMPASTVTEMEKIGLDKKKKEKVLGPRGNIIKLSEAGAKLSPDMTDRAVRVLRIANLAEKVFRNSSKAMTWLHLPNEVLGARPMDLLVRETGATLVEEALLRINHSVVA